jgi:hypothetical protein
MYRVLSREKALKRLWDHPVKAYVLKEMKLSIVVAVNNPAKKIISISLGTSERDYDITTKF